MVFRWQLPEEKVILPLDSQRTYRVFENLLVNITKYAMPGTRVYVNMENTENHVKIIMKNISATELNFNPSEITERFVREILPETQKAADWAWLLPRVSQSSRADGWRC